MFRSVCDMCIICIGYASKFAHLELPFNEEYVPKHVDS